MFLMIKNIYNRNQNVNMCETPVKSFFLDQTRCKGNIFQWQKDVCSCNQNVFNFFYIQSLTNFSAKKYGRKKWVQERRLILVVFPCQIARVFDCHSSRFILSQRYVYMGNWQVKCLLTQVIFDFCIILCREWQKSEITCVTKF